MSRPVYEPSLPRTDAELGFGSRQLFRRPAQPAADGTEVVQLFSWEANGVGDDLVPNATWTTIAATGVRRFSEVFEVLDDTTPAMTYNQENGIITLQANAEYMIHGWMQYSEDAQVNNEMRAVAILRATGSSSERIINTYRFDIADGAIAAMRLQVGAHWLRGFGTHQMGIEVYQNSGGNLTIAGAEFLIRRHEFTADGTFFT